MRTIDPLRYRCTNIGEEVGGNYHRVQRVQAEILNAKRARVIHLVVRRFDPAIPHGMGPSQTHEFDMHALLSGTKIPVIPTMRLDDDDVVYQTDLTEGGRKFVISAFNTPFDALAFIDAVEAQRDRLPDGHAVLCQMDDIASRCAAARVHIARPDALFFVIDLQSRGNTIVRVGNYAHVRESAEDVNELYEKNIGVCADAFSNPQLQKLYGWTRAGVYRELSLMRSPPSLVPAA